MIETLPRLMLVTDRRRCRGDLVERVVEAARGGAGLVQVREKDLLVSELQELVRKLHRRLPRETLLVVNGDASVAHDFETGLHLPASAPPPAGLRPRPCGRSVHDVAEARRARGEGVDYVVAGPVYPTPAKPGHPGAGVALIAAVREAVDAIPVFGIGGIQVSNAAPVVHAGAHGVAVCGPFMTAVHPRRLAEGLRLALEVAVGTRAGRGGGAGGPDRSPGGRR